MAVPAVRPRNVAGLGGSTSNGGSSPVPERLRPVIAARMETDSELIVDCVGTVIGWRRQLTGSGFESERPAAGFTPSLGLSPHTSRTSIQPRAADAVDADSRNFRHLRASRRRCGHADHRTVVWARTSEGNRSTSAQRQQWSGTGLRRARQQYRLGQRLGAHRNRRGRPQRKDRICRTRGRTRFFGRVGSAPRVRNQLGGLPSDAAPHTPPPRMPIEHHD